jgi:hypothetical protein
MPMRLRVSYWDIGGRSSDLWDTVTRTAAGTPVRSRMDEINERLAGTQPVFPEANCNDSPLDRGFVLYRETRLEGAGNAVEDFPATAGKRAFRYRAI